MAKKDNIRLQLSKSELKSSIDRHNSRERYVVRIQSVVRRHFVRVFLRLSGWRQCKESDCVNDSDFYTLERFHEFPREFLYFHPSFEKYYGFHICSLVTMLQKGYNELMNPYTRETINQKDIMQMFYLLPILFPDVVALHKEVFDIMQMTKGIKRKREEEQQQQQNTLPVTIIHGIPILPEILWNPFEYNNIEYSPYYTRLNFLNILTESSEMYTQQQCDLMMKMAFLETMQLERRIIEIFIDIDLMGNYTSADWFFEMNRHQLRNLYVFMQHSWNQLSENVRKAICILGNPFDVFRINNMAIPLYHWRVICVSIMELLTYCGETLEDRKLGVLHILYALCNTSNSARIGLQHLL
jgi:hypothetical protein